MYAMYTLQIQKKRHGYLLTGFAIFRPVKL